MLVLVISFYALWLNIRIYSRKITSEIQKVIILLWLKLSRCHYNVEVVLYPAHFNKHNVTFIKLGKNDVNMMTSWCNGFPCYNVLGCFSLKEREHLLNIWCKIKIYFTRDHGKSYCHLRLHHS